MSDKLVHIPALNTELSHNWRQPSNTDIEVDERHAMMSQVTFEKLQNYSGNLPKGIYEGKMWRRLVKLGLNQRWRLCWYRDSKLNKGHCEFNERDILIT